MPNDTMLRWFDELNTWKQGDQRAPHKPLLILYALGQWQQGKTEFTFKSRAQVMREPSRRRQKADESYQSQAMSAGAVVGFVMSLVGRALVFMLVLLAVTQGLKAKTRSH